MQKHEDWLKEWINKGMFNNNKNHDPKSWRSQVIGQCNSWIESGLKERSMTRDLDWGVKVPVENNDGKVLYVWLDAPIGYITGLYESAFGNSFPRRGDYDYIRVKTEEVFYDPKVATKDLVDRVFDIANKRESTIRLLAFAKSCCFLCNSACCRCNLSLNFITCLCDP